VGKAKGIALVGAVRLLRAKRAQATALLPPDLQHYLDEWVQTSSWYPARDLSRLLATLAKILHPSAPDIALEQMGIATARAQADVYRDLLIGAGSTSRTFALFSTQLDSGELRSRREDAGRVRFELVDFEDTRASTACCSPATSGALELNEARGRERREALPAGSGAIRRAPGPRAEAEGGLSRGQVKEHDGARLGQFLRLRRDDALRVLRRSCITTWTSASARPAGTLSTTSRSSCARPPR
jgi:hypothetical protein